MNYQDFHHWIRWFFPGLKRSWNALYNLSNRSMNVLLNALPLTRIYQGLEWQWIPVEHFFRLIKLSTLKKSLRQGVIYLPAISIPFLIAKK